MNVRVVLKFGGSVLRDGEGFLRAANYAANLLHSRSLVVAVVSAAKGVTDALISLYRNRDEEIIRSLRSRYEKIIEAIPNPKFRERALERIKAELKKLRKPMSYDEFVSKGEDHSGIILSHFLMALGYKAEYMDGYKAGMVADSNGVLKENLSILNVKRSLARLLGSTGGIVPIVGGFVGRELETGEHKLLGRNSTDVTGAIIAAALNADYEIIKDVPGIYVVEPEYGKTQVIPRLSYDEAGELTWRGIEVVHPMAIKVAKSHGIPIRVRNLKGGTSTLISKESITTKERPVAAISARKFYLLTISDEFMNTPEGRGYLSNATKILSDCGIDVYDVATSANAISITIHPSHRFIEKEKIEIVVRKCLEEYGYKPMVEGKPVGAISVTGEAIKGNTEILSRLVNALNESNVQVLMVSKSLNSSNVIFVVDERDLSKGVNAVYRMLFPKRS